MTGLPLYDRTAQEAARNITRAYSTSFGLASRLFPVAVRPHIYNIYGLVRIADEIVDTYKGDDMINMLDGLESEVVAALRRGYSPNPVVHAFQLTANRYGITGELINPFFASMRLDTAARHFDAKLYQTYIYGSAEVVGLMCVRVFVAADDSRYAELESGARALGAAFQKVNFLRDIAADQHDLKRWYFPDGDFAGFDNAHKRRILHDIMSDFQAARPAVAALPPSARPAVRMAYEYYFRLYRILEKTDAAVIKRQRVRVPDRIKFGLYIRALVRARLAH